MIPEAGHPPGTPRPGKPQNNGAHERMHRTLQAEACRPARGTFSAQRRALNDSAGSTTRSGRLTHQASRRRTEALRNETLGFEWVADQLWSVFLWGYPAGALRRTEFATPGRHGPVKVFPMCPV
jgi:hypothetical protein